ncbi:MAG: hypothetical protein ACI92E_001157 [Oceanicoccus sp.]
MELSSEEVAIVVAEYLCRRLRPQLMLLLDKDKLTIEDICYIDLLETTHTKDGDALEIVNSLKTDAYAYAYGIDMNAIAL